MLTHLATVGRPGLALLTSREALKDLDEWANSPSGAALRIDLGNLSDRDGAALLHAEGPTKPAVCPSPPMMPNFWKPANRSRAMP